MAINLNCNLNGGDSVTPNNELFYRIYGNVDNYTVPIHTTGTAISDTDVTVTGDVVDILNVDGTTNTSFKISAVDGAGNEGILSDSNSSTIIELHDDFTGTTIDETKWDVENSGTPTVQYTQDDELIGTVADYSDGASGFENWVHSLNAITTPTKVVSFDFKQRLTNVLTIYQIKLQNTNTTASTEAIGIAQGTTTTSAKLSKKENNVGSSGTDLPIDVSSYKTFKFIITGTAGEGFYWDGLAWVSFGTATFTNSFDCYLMIISRPNSGNTVGDGINIDNFYVTGQDFLTQYPT